MITAVDYKNDILLISLLEGVVQAYELKENDLKLLGEINLGQERSFEVTSVALTEFGNLACVTLCDPPLFSLFILSVPKVQNGDFKILEQRSLQSILEPDSLQDQILNTQLSMSMTTTEENTEDKEMKDDQNTNALNNQPNIQDLYASNEYLNCDLPCSASRSLKIITASSGDPNSTQEDRTTRRSSSNLKKSPMSYLVFTFSDGRVLTMSLDHAEAMK